MNGNWVPKKIFCRWQARIGFIRYYVSGCLKYDYWFSLPATPPLHASYQEKPKYCARLYIYLNFKKTENDQVN